MTDVSIKIRILQIYPKEFFDKHKLELVMKLDQKLEDKQHVSRS